MDICLSFFWLTERIRTLFCIIFAKIIFSFFSAFCLVFVFFLGTKDAMWPGWIQVAHFPCTFGLISILALFQRIFRVPALLCTWFFNAICSIDFFAGAEIFLCWVFTNGSGAVSWILFTLSNSIWIHELVLGWVCFLPRSHAVDVGPS